MVIIMVIIRAWKWRCGGLLTSGRYQIVQVFIGQAGRRVSTFMQVNLKTNKPSLRSLKFFGGAFIRFLGTKELRCFLERDCPLI